MKNVEDVYPLSPMQEVMLFHASTRTSHDVLFNQICYEIEGPLESRAFQGAWQAVLDRHPALRSAFLWRGLKKPQQVVRQALELPYEYLDWCKLPEQEQLARFEQIRNEDRAKPFNAEKAPLMRVTLIRVTDTLHWMVWSSHHLILDRWCTAVVLDDLAGFYQVLLGGKPALPGKGRSYREYIGWTQRQSSVAARQFWTQELVGFDQATPITESARQSNESSEAALFGNRHISGEELLKLRAFCRANRLTLASLVQGAWSLILNQCTSSQDVVFGVVVSGRPADVPDVDNIIGSFVNNVPARVRLPGDRSVIAWLQDLQLRAQKRASFEHVSVAQLEAWCELPPVNNLFDSIIVWLADSGRVEFAGLQLKGISSDMGTAYPLTISVEETEDVLAFSGQLNSGFSLSQNLDSLLSQLCKTLVLLSALDESRRLSEIDEFRGVLTSRELESGRRIKENNSAMPEFHPVDNPELNASGREDVDLELVEEYVRYEWLQIFQSEEIASDADFFLLGGDSLMAARLLSRIEQTAHKNIPLLALFETPTISGMAEVIQNENWSLKPMILSPIKARGKLPPLFCIASPEVNTLGYSVLTRYLHEDRPVFVLQAPPDGVAMRSIKPAELPALAEKYIAALQTVQATGSYCILGMCTGALLSIEIARQLEARGQKLAFLGIINTWALFTLSKFYYLQRIFNRLGYYRGRVAALVSLAADQRTRALRKAVITRIPGFSLSSTGSASALPIAQDDVRGDQVVVDSPQEENPDSLIDIVGWGTSNPDTQMYSGAVTVFRAKKDIQRLWRISDRNMGWNKHAHSVNRLQLPVNDHDDILREPYVRSFAVKLESCLPQEVHDV